MMCEALYDMATYFNIPMTSGKDSMKNDFKSDGKKISVPPTILYSMVAKIDDVRNTVTTTFKASGDLVYILGKTYNELGCSEFLKLFGELGKDVPKVRKEDAKMLYQKVMVANEKRLIQSSHDISDGGMIVSIVESAFGSNYGVEVALDKFEGLDTNSILFSESHSRFIVSINPNDKSSFESIMGNYATLIGKVIDSKNVTVYRKGNKIMI
jgi:phosphoribosylformylglycinamidine synthase